MSATAGVRWSLYRWSLPKRKGKRTSWHVLDLRVRHGEDLMLCGVHAPSYAAAAELTVLGTDGSWLGLLYVDSFDRMVAGLKELPAVYMAERDVVPPADVCRTCRHLARAEVAVAQALAYCRAMHAANEKWTIYDGAKSP